MGVHTGKLTVCSLSNSEAGQRSTLQGKGVGIFSNEEERGSDSRQTTYPGAGASWARRSPVQRCHESLVQTFWVFVYLWPIILFLSSHLTGPWTLPKMHTQLFAKMDPTAESSGCMSTPIMGWGPLPFWPPRSLSSCVQTGTSSLTSVMGPLSLCFSRAQLLPLALTWECLPEDKAWILLHLTNTRGLARGQLSPASASGPSCFVCCRLLYLTLIHPLTLSLIFVHLCLSQSTWQAGSRDPIPALWDWGLIL